MYRYNSLYVTQFQLDIRGVFFSKAINQLVVGLYVMELCLVGLFLLAEDETTSITPCRG